MRRTVLVIVIALAACGSRPEAVPRSPSPQTTASPGQRHAYRLLTHCGITHAQFAGTTWKADPVLSDGQGNPPAGWGNPFEDGTLELRADGTLLFRGPGGRTARFLKAPPGFTPGMCD